MDGWERELKQGLFSEGWAKFALEPENRCHGLKAIFILHDTVKIPSFIFWELLESEHNTDQFICSLRPKVNQSFRPQRARSDKISNLKQVWTVRSHSVVFFLLFRNNVWKLSSVRVHRNTQ